MPPNLNPLESRREWARASRQNAAPVLDAASRLRTAVEAGIEWLPGTLPDPAAELVAACAELSTWLDVVRTPRGFGRAHAEIKAACGVLRNAAFVFRSLVDTKSDLYEARLHACQSMLKQGDEHVRGFLAKTESAV
jgi:hypothetical protein